MTSAITRHEDRYIKPEAEPHSSVGNLHDLRTEGRWFDTRLAQYSFQGLIIVVHCDRIHSPLTAVHYFDNSYVGKAASGLERILCGELVKRTPVKHG